MIILECVQRLGHKRQVDPDDRQGTLYIQDELAGLGFVGEWVNVSAKEFFLPQSRPRVYGLFLKLTDLSGVGREQRKRDVAAAVRLIQRLRVPGEPEPLERVLQRCQALQYDGSRDRPKKGRHAAPPMGHALGTCRPRSLRTVRHGGVSTTILCRRCP